MTDQQDSTRLEGKSRRKEARKAQRDESRRRAKEAAAEVAAAAADAAAPVASDQGSPLSADDRPSFKDRLHVLRNEMAELIATKDSYKFKLEQAFVQMESLALQRRDLEHRRLRRKWAVPVTQPMLLISQVPRSGGTLLGRLFDGHPECFAHPMELRWGRPKESWPAFTADPSMSALEAYDLLAEKWQERLVEAGGYSKYPKLMQEGDDAVQYPFVYDSDLAFEIFADAYGSEGGTATRRAVLNAHLTSLFNGWLDYQNLYATPKRWVTCFLPTMVTVAQSVERFFEDYPDGRLVTMVRHPGSWFASFDSFSRFKGGVVLSESMALWLASAKASVDAVATYGDRVTIVLFEDLVLRTEATMRGICARMKIAFDPVLLRPTYNGIPILSDSSFRLSAAIDPETTGRHHTELAADQRAEIDRIATPIYDELARRLAREQSV